MTRTDDPYFRISAPNAVWILTSLCTILHRPVDAALLASECAGELEDSDFVALSAKLGLSVLPTTVTDDTTVPAVARFLRSSDAPDKAAELTWILILSITSSEVTYVHPSAKTPEVVVRTEFERQLVGKALVVKNATPSALDPDAVNRTTKAFGFSWFVPELLKHKRIWRDVLIASLCIQLMALAFPLFTQAILDKVVVHRTQSTLIALAVGMGIFTVFTAGLTWVRQYLVLHTGNRVDAVLGRHVFEHLLRLPLPYFAQRPTGVIAARLNGIETIREFVSSAAVTLALDLPFVVIFVAAMFFYSTSLTLIVIGTLSLIVAASAIAAPLFQKRLNEQFLRGAANQAFVTEYVSGMETVKSLQLEPQLNARYRDQLAAFLNASFRTRQLGNTYGAIANALEQLMNLLILSVGAYLVMTSGALTVGMLIAFQMFASRIAQPTLRMVGLWQQFQQARMAVARLGDLMDAPAEPYRLFRSRPQERASSLSAQSLAFRYAENRPFLYEGLDLNVNAGELVVVAGPSGVGKSTLAKLMQGFFQPTRGTICVDNIDIRYLAANELRSYFGVVPQETTLFSGTLLDNLTLANPFASFEQVVAACKMAEIHATIEALPVGYHTEIGERGVGLSGGQRQRIAIARALLKGPRILIFDEATSSLDTLTAEQIGRTVNALKGKVTMLFIAHATPRTLSPDRIVRLGEKLSVVPSEKTESAVYS